METLFFYRVYMMTNICHILWLCWQFFITVGISLLAYTGWSGGSVFFCCYFRQQHRDRCYIICWQFISLGFSRWMTVGIDICRIHRTYWCIFGVRKMCFWLWSEYVYIDTFIWWQLTVLNVRFIIFQLQKHSAFFCCFFAQKKTV